MHCLKVFWDSLSSQIHKYPKASSSRFPFSTQLFITVTNIWSFFFIFPHIFEVIKYRISEPLNLIHNICPIIQLFKRSKIQIINSKLYTRISNVTQFGVINIHRIQIKKQSKHTKMWSGKRMYFFNWSCSSSIICHKTNTHSTISKSPPKQYCK